MVLKFRMISNEEEGFIRDFDILADQTFYQLHMAIQDNLHYDKSQIASFFICNQEWQKQQEITLFELSEEESAKALTMDSAKISDHMKKQHDKMIYVFDVFNERLFFIELAEIFQPEPDVNYPVCSFSHGCPPQQVLMDRLFNNRDLTEGDGPDGYFGEDPFENGEDAPTGHDSMYFEDDFPDE